jgi:hypothetical protein
MGDTRNSVTIRARQREYRPPGFYKVKLTKCRWSPILPSQRKIWQTMGVLQAKEARYGERRFSRDQAIDLPGVHLR